MITDKHFIDWESHVFGYGYGTGEEHTLRVLKKLFDLPTETPYNYKFCEAVFGREVWWLLVNILCKADIFEYGTSPRNVWFTDKGLLLKEYFCSKTFQQLYDLTSTPEEYYHCYPDHHNCDKKNLCNNPLF